MFEGDLKSIKQSLNNISIKTTNQFAKGLVDFKIKLVNYLGNTGLEKETEFFELNYFLNPKPSLPEIDINSSLISQMDGFSLQPLSNFIKAISPDFEEEIYYLIQFPEERHDLYLFDDDFKKIGIETNQGYLLSSAEWNKSIIGSENGNTNKFQLALELSVKNHQIIPKQARGFLI